GRPGSRGKASSPALASARCSNTITSTAYQSWAAAGIANASRTVAAARVRRMPESYRKRFDELLRILEPRPRRQQGGGAAQRRAIETILARVRLHERQQRLGIDARLRREHDATAIRASL